MGEQFLLVEYISSGNNIIKNTFQKGHRVKLTSFDVSTKFLVFGASTGGIYIFTREPCEFLKLIPSTYGSAVLVAISENEENLAVATSIGSVVILENCFNESNYQQQVFNEHYGQIITAIKWNNFDVYFGDNSGKVSVITTNNFITKSIFQPPVACLMHLESSIIQIDTYSKLLLITTKTRTLLCDTETECYRQIGKKARGGPYGACFFNIPLTNVYYELPQKRGVFRLITGDNEQLSQDFSDDIIIYCARPGIRLWQANCQAVVKLTHQFRSKLIDRQIQQVDLIVIDDCLGEEARLEIRQFPDEITNVVDTFNFGKIYNLFNRFILTYNQYGLFIFDPKCSDLLLWTNYYKNIRDVKIQNSTIYLWCDQFKIAMLSCTLIDDLITKILYKKQYKLCGDLCVKFSNLIEMNLNKSDKLQQLSVLENKLNDDELLVKIQPILDKIQTLPKPVQVIKDKTGIILINNQYEQNCDQYSTTKSPYDIVVEQYKFNRINQNLETSDFLKLIEIMDANQMREILQIFSKDSQINSEDLELWCFEIFLKILSKSNNLTNLSKSTLDYASKAFLFINNNKENCGVCCCGFPLPKSRKFPPKFYEIGVKLMVITGDYDDFTRTIPYMNRYILENIDNSIDIKLKLPLILQYSDIDIIKKIMMKSTYDIWDESIKLLTKLKRNNCLYCNNCINIDDVLIWKDFLCVMVESINAKNTMELLKSYSNLISNHELDEFFYQFCIFQYSTEIENSMKLSFFRQTIEKDDRLKREFQESIGEFLNRKYHGTSKILPTKSSTLLNCDYCTMPLKTPIVDKITNLSCGHNYHQICYHAIDEKCSICRRL